MLWRSRRVSRRAVAVLSALAFVGVGGSGPGYAPAAEPAPARPPDRCADESADAADAARGRIGRDVHDTRHYTTAERAAIERRTDRILARKNAAAGSQGDVQATEIRRIPVYFHVIRSKSGKGGVSNKRIDRQIKVLNRTYAGRESDAAANTSFRFDLKDRTRYRNTRWFNGNRSLKMRRITRQGGRRALNIWTLNLDVLGIATFPWQQADRPKLDGIRVHFRSVPGGSLTHYNRGKTATHESGHWLGLWHTFQGGCAAPGDHVGDTPAEATPSQGCPEGKDTCGSSGKDPIHNYMDYSYDTCYNQFTSGQNSRMNNMWAAYRA
ncbi:MAG: zinc metalloprotease [Propionibacteriales bacterium]|nr:zinc metalloprotease [Propionibacteriales bacterium]